MKTEETIQNVFICESKEVLAQFQHFFSKKQTDCLGGNVFKFTGLII
jgi:hypothetical protein